MAEFTEELMDGDLMDGNVEERIRLIEAMMLEGRRSTEYRGWIFLVWGVAYVLAIGWIYLLPYPQWSWAVLMPLAAVVTTVGERIRRKRNPEPSTVKSRALMAIWSCSGISIFLFAFTAGWSGHPDVHVVLAGIEILLGLANGASALTLRWRPQMGVALVWWICGVASEFAPATALVPILLAGTLVGNLGFGTYLMVRESADRGRRVGYVAAS